MDANAVADLLSADDLRRLERLYLILRSVETDYRSVALALNGLATKHVGQHDLVRDLFAALDLIEQSLRRTEESTNAISQEYLRSHGERAAQLDAALQKAAGADSPVTKH